MFHLAHQLRWSLVTALLVGCAPNLEAWKTLPEVPAGEQNELPVPERGATFVPQLTKKRLANGLDVVVVKDDEAEMVAVSARYPVGAAHDPAGKEGLAHLVEHLLFEQRPGGDDQRSIGEALRETAIEFNATTTWDSTHFYAIAPRARLEELVRLEALRLNMGCRGVDDATFAVHREIVLNELRTRASSGGILALLEQAYPKGHPYSRPVGGTVDSVSRLTLADACAFIAEKYAPESVTVTIAGRVSAQDLALLSERWLERIPKRTLPLQRRLPRAVIQPRRVEQVARIESPQIMLAWPIPGRFTGQGMVGELLIKQLRIELAGLVYEDDLAKNLYVSRIGGAEAELLVVMAELPEDADIPAVEQRLSAALAGVPDGLDEGRLRYLRSLLQLDLLNAIDPLLGQVQLIPDYAQFDESERGFAGDMARTADAKVADVQQLARTVLSTEHQLSLILRPDPSAPPEAAERASARVEAHAEARWKQFIDPSAADRPYPYRSDSKLLENAERYQLANGLQVVMLPSSFAPTMRAQLVFGSGYLDADTSSGALAHSAVELLESSRSGDDGRYADAGEVLGGMLFDIDVRMGPSTTTFDASGFASLQDFAIQGLGRLFVEGYYSKKKAGKALARQQDRASSDEAARDRRVKQLILEQIYGADHPYVAHSRKVDAALDVAALREFKARHLVPSNATLILTGKIDPAIVRPHIERVLGRWSPGKAARAASPVTWPPLPKRTQPINLAVPQAEAETSQRMVEVVVAYPTDRAIDGSYAARLVAAEMLAMRVRAVREQHAAAYIVGADYVETEGPGMFVIHGTVDGARGGEALRAMRAAIVSLSSAEDFAVDFVLARRAVVEQLLAGRLDRRAIASQLGFLARRRLRPDFFATLTAEVAALTAGAARAALATDLVEGREVVVVSGKAALVAKTYADAGIDDIRTVESSAPAKKK